MAYRDISRGVRLAKDHEQYMLWLNKDTAARQTAYAAVNTPADRVNINRVPGYLVPFSSDGPNLVYLPARLIAEGATGRGAPTATTVRTILEAYTFSDEEVKTLPSNTNVLDGVKYTPAKMTLIQRMQTATTKSASRITGRTYYRHENDAVTGNFGKKIAEDTYGATVVAIKAKAAYTAFFTGAANANNKVRFVPEKF
jgi:hypothetical protein